MQRYNTSDDNQAVHQKNKPESPIISERWYNLISTDLESADQIAQRELQVSRKGCEVAGS